MIRRVIRALLWTYRSTRYWVEHPNTRRYAWTNVGLWSFAIATSIVAVALNIWSGTWGWQLLNAPVLAFDVAWLVHSVRGLRHVYKAGLAGRDG